MSVGSCNLDRCIQARDMQNTTSCPSPPLSASFSDFDLNANQKQASFLATIQHDAKGSPPRRPHVDRSRKTPSQDRHNWHTRTHARACMRTRTGTCKGAHTYRGWHDWLVQAQVLEVVAGQSPNLLPPPTAPVCAHDLRLHRPLPLLQKWSLFKSILITVARMLMLMKERVQTTPRVVTLNADMDGDDHKALITLIPAIMMDCPSSVLRNNLAAMNVSSSGSLQGDDK